MRDARRKCAEQMSDARGCNHAEQMRDTRSKCATREANARHAKQKRDKGSKKPAKGKNKDAYVPFLHGGAALRLHECFYECDRTAPPAYTPPPPTRAQGSSAARTRARIFGKKMQKNGRVLAKKTIFLMNC